MRIDTFRQIYTFVLTKSAKTGIICKRNMFGCILDKGCSDEKYRCSYFGLAKLQTNGHDR